MTRVEDTMSRTIDADAILNDLLVSDVIRRHEFQVWFVAEHAGDVPLVKAV